MSVDLPARGPLTDRYLDYLVAKFEDFQASILVGDAVKPPGAGWPGTPQDEQTAKFASYVTIGTGPATQPRDEPPQLTSQNTAWLCSYTMTSVGAVRQQADYVADIARAATMRFPGDDNSFTLGSEDWAVESVTIPRLGSVDRNDTTDPPYWQVLDTAVIRITRAHKRTNR